MWLLVQRYMLKVIPDPFPFMTPSSFTQRNQVAPFKRHDEFAPVATVAVFLEGHTLDSFVQWGHSTRSVCLGRIAASA